MSQRDEWRRRLAAIEKRLAYLHRERRIIARGPLTVTRNTREAELVAEEDQLRAERDAVLDRVRRTEPK